MSATNQPEEVLRDIEVAPLDVDDESYAQSGYARQPSRSSEGSRRDDIEADDNSDDEYYENPVELIREFGNNPLMERYDTSCVFNNQ